MKRYILYTIYLAAFTSAIFLYSSFSSISNTKSNLEYLSEKYNSFYEALFSIDDLKSFSIIQNESTISIYNNNWVSPKTYVEVLTDDEKTNLKNNLTKYLDNLSENERIKTTEKIKSWCMIHEQFSLMTNSLDIYPNNLMEVLNTNKLTSSVFDQFNLRGTINIENLSQENKEKAFYESINIISSLDYKDQLAFYGDTFNRLSEFASY